MTYFNNNNVSKNEFNKFIDYVFICYDQKWTKKQIKKATILYLFLLEFSKVFTWGSGDSIDRERVNLILEGNFEFGEFSIKG